MKSSELQLLDDANFHISVPNNIEENDNLTDPSNSKEYKNFQEESEDNDGENRNVKNENKNTIIGTSITIIKAMIGCGILNLPLVFKYLGIRLAIFFIICSILISIFTVYLLLKSKEITQRYSFSVYAKLSFGSSGTFFMKITIMTLCFFTCCIFLKIFSDVFRNILLLFFNNNSFLKGNYLMIFIFFLLSPLMFKKDITSLQKYSFIGVISVFIFIFCIIIVFLYKFSKNEIIKYNENMKKPKGNFIQIFTAITSMLNSFCFQANTFPIYLTLKPRNSKNMIKSTLLASFITGLIYLLTGLLGYFMYGDIIEDNLLTYFKTDIQKYLKSNLLISFILLISEIAFFISAMLAMPIVFFALKSNLFNLIRFLFKKIKRKRFNSASYEGINNNFKKTSFLNEKSKFILTGITYFCVLLFAIGVEKIIVIDNIVGSTADNIIYFIAPGFFVLRLGKKYLNKFESFIAKFYIFIGSITIGIFILIQLGIIK